MTREEIAESLKLLKEQARKSHKDTAILNVKIESFEWVIESAIQALSQEPKTGHWIKHEHGFWSWVNKNGERDGWIPDYECSECGSRAWEHKTNYCPQCGAWMFEPQESEDKE